MIKKFLKYSIMTLFMFVMLLDVCRAYTPVSSFESKGYKEDECTYVAYTSPNGRPLRKCGIYRFSDTNNNALFCLQFGTVNDPRAFSFSDTHTYQRTIKGQGIACGLTKLYENKKMTAAEIESFAKKNQIEIQKALWDNEYICDGNNNCVKNETEVCTDVLYNTTEAEAINFSFKVSNKELKLNSKGDLYVSSPINVETNVSSYSLELQGAPEGAYISIQNGGQPIASMDNITVKTLYLVVPVEKVKSKMNIKLIAKYSFTTKTNHYLTPIVYEYKPSKNFTTQGDLLEQEENTQLVGKIDFEYKDVPESGSDSEQVVFISKAGTLTIIKIDSKTDKPIEGAAFELYDEKGQPAKRIDGTVVERVRTDAEGKIVIENLPHGTYKLKEVEPAPGYVANSETLEIKILDDGKTVNVTNNPVKTKISKRDISTDKALVGAHIVIYDESNNVVAEFDSKKESEEIYLGPGKFILRETVAPNGYDRITRDFKFEVLKNGNIKLISGSNDKVCDFSTLTANPGDVDNDGNVDVTDTVILNKFLKGWETEDTKFDCQKYLNADVNGDGIVNLNDVGALQRLNANWNLDYVASGCTGVDVDSLTLLAGDVNGDGVVNETDVTYLGKHLGNIEGFELSCQAYINADVNADGTLDTDDLDLLRKFLAKWNVGLKLSSLTDINDTEVIITDDKNFKVNKNEIILYNSLTVVDVPNTLKSSTIYAIIGTVLLLSGGALIYLTIRKRKIQI